MVLATAVGESILTQAFEIAPKQAFVTSESEDVLPIFVE